tara:strand:+ start:435 stop:713 length:279 start_codon:yes stop_codon:yes gene_type:complete
MNKKQKNGWQKKAEEYLLGKTIVKIEWMSSYELEDMMWYKAPICLKLDDGSYIFPLADDEANDGGSLSHFNELNNAPNFTFPVFSKGWEEDE